MKLQNNFSTKVFWRTFDSKDTSRSTGLAQGSIKPGRSINWRNPHDDVFQMEIKTGDIVFSTSVLEGARTDRLRHNNKDYAVARNGAVVEVLDIKNSRSKHVTVTDISFVNLLDSVNPVQRDEEYVIQKSETVVNTVENTHEHAQTWRLDGSFSSKVGGTIGPVSAEASPTISAGFEDKVTDKLTETYQHEVTTAWSEKVNEGFECPASHITVIERVWTLTIEEGIVADLDEEARYSVLRGAKGRVLSVQNYKSFGAMPTRYKKAWSGPIPAETNATNTIVAGAFYRLKNGKSNLYISSNSATQLGSQIIQKGNAGRGEQWELIKMGDAYRIRNRHSKLYVANFGARNNRAVLKQTNNPGSGALWKIAPRSNGTFQLQNALSGLFMANLQRMNAMAPIVQVKSPGSGSLWRFERV
jgi:hypothetical protein